MIYYSLDSRFLSVADYASGRISTEKNFREWKKRLGALNLSCFQGRSSGDHYINVHCTPINMELAVCA